MTYLVYLRVPLAQPHEHLGAVRHLLQSDFKVALVIAEDFAHRDADKDARRVAGDAQAISRDLSAGDTLGVDDDRRDGLGLLLLRAEAAHWRQEAEPRVRHAQPGHERRRGSCVRELRGMRVAKGGRGSEG